MVGGGLPVTLQVSTTVVCSFAVVFNGFSKNEGAVPVLSSEK